MLWDSRPEWRIAFAPSGLCLSFFVNGCNTVVVINGFKFSCVKYYYTMNMCHLYGLAVSAILSVQLQGMHSLIRLCLLPCEDTSDLLITVIRNSMLNVEVFHPRQYVWTCLKMTADVKSDKSKKSNQSSFIND